MRRMAQWWPIVMTACGDAAAIDDGSTGTTIAMTTDDGAGGAGPTEPDVVSGPRIERATPISTPGSSVFVQTDVPIAGVELTLAGEPLPEPPILTGGGAGGEYGALYRLPAGLAVGDAVLRVRSRGAAADSDEATISIVAPSFVDVADATGLTNVHDVSGHPEACAWSSTGLAFGDIDDDGDSDFYVGNVGAPGRLLRNDGDQDGDGLPDFVDITAAAGPEVDDVSMASFMDYDNDGDRDLFVGRRGTNVLLRNLRVETGEAKFSDVTAEVGLGGEKQRTMGVAWGDHDGDGDLDLYVVNHAQCFPYKDSELRSQDHFYRNDAGVFTEITEQLGLAPGSPVHSLGFSAAFVDHDRDGDQDLIVINDHIAGLGGPNALWRNDGPGAAPGEWRFTDIAEAAGLAIAPMTTGGDGANGMGLAIGDVDRDGYPDVAFTNIGPNHLLINQRDGTYKNISADAGVRRGLLAWQSRSITWGVHLFDQENDGDLDLYFAGGTIHDGKLIPDAMLRNDGKGFVEVTWAAGLTDLGSAKASALVDLDRDGLLEFATAHWARPLRVYHNQHGKLHGPRNHWLVVDLVGTTSNRDALGSIVELETSAGPQTCFRTPNPSLGAGGELGCHFGLGAAEAVARLTITWPDGQVVEVDPPAVDQRVTFVQ